MPESRHCSTVSSLWFVVASCLVETTDVYVHSHSLESTVLAQRDAAIVSSQAGTTRDVLEVQLNLAGIKCRLQDTAGVRSFTTDDIERIGMERAVKAFSTADVVIAMVDSTDLKSGVEILQTMVRNQTMSAESSILTSPRKTPMLLVLNKSDKLNNGPTGATQPEEGVPNRAHETQLADAGLERHVQKVFEVSCITQQGMDEFMEHLTSTVVQRVSWGSPGEEGEASQSPAASSSVLITRARHRQHIADTVSCLERFRVMAKQGSSVMDLAAEELRLAASELGRVTGAVDVEDVLDKLFTDFCIGK